MPEARGCIVLCIEHRDYRCCCEPDQLLRFGSRHVASMPGATAAAVRARRACQNSHWQSFALAWSVYAQRAGPGAARGFGPRNAAGTAWHCG